MPARSITHREGVTPHLHSKRSATTLGFMRRAMRFQKLTKNLSQLHARGVYVPQPGSSARQAVVKVWQATPTTTATQLRYLAHGKGIDGQDAEVFGPHGGAIHEPAMASRVRDDPHQWRLMISPEAADRLDLKTFALDYMRQVEDDLQTTLDYALAIHHDTDYPHIHAVVSGRDEYNEPLYLQKDYLTHGLTYRAQTLATDRLGPVQEYPLGPREQSPQRILSRVEVEQRMRESLERAQRIRDRIHGRGMER